MKNKSSKKCLKLKSDKYTGRIANIDKDYLYIWIESNLYQLKTPDEIKKDFYINDIIEFELRKKNISTIQLLNRSAKTLLDKSDILKWRYPVNNTNRMEILKYRHKLLRTFEKYFDEEGFLQVNIPALIKFPNPESQLNIVKIKKGCLSTSPELQMKRMLAGGFSKIVSIGPCFREHELSQFHNPEFTMAEWYRAGEELDRIIEDVQNIWLACAGKFPNWNKKGFIEVNNNKIQMEKIPWKRISVKDLILDNLGLDIADCITSEELYDIGAKKKLFSIKEKNESFEILFSILWDKLEKNIGTCEPVFITDWPTPLASLARINPSNQNICDRVELVIGGLEIANGFNELINYSEHLVRFKKSIQERKEKKLEQFSYDKKFINAIESGIPPTSGIALGFDRMCMLLTKAEHIKDTLAFSWDEL